MNHLLPSTTFGSFSAQSGHAYQLASCERQRIRLSRLADSEMMTIVILFHQSQYRNFKAFYLAYVRRHLKDAFPGLVSYARFVALMESMGVIVCVFACEYGALHRDFLRGQHAPGCLS